MIQHCKRRGQSLGRMHYAVSSSQQRLSQGIVVHWHHVVVAEIFFWHWERLANLMVQILIVDEAILSPNDVQPE